MRRPSADEVDQRSSARTVCGESVGPLSPRRRRAGLRSPTGARTATCRSPGPAAGRRRRVRLSRAVLRFERSVHARSGPGDAPPRNARVRSYPVRERDRMIWIRMGAPEAADPALIPRRRLVRRRRVDDEPRLRELRRRLPARRRQPARPLARDVRARRDDRRRGGCGLARHRGDRRRPATCACTA